MEDGGGKCIEAGGLIISVEYGLVNGWSGMKGLQCFNEHHLIFIFPVIIIFILLGIPVEFFFEMTTAVTVHLGLVLIFTENAGDVGLVYFKLYKNHAPAEVL